MFLDDQLVEIVKNTEIKETADINKLNKILLNKCQNYYVENIKIGMLKKDAKKIIDKTFNLFDSFVRILKKSNDLNLNYLGEVFEKYSFKNHYMADEKLKEFYESLK